jgi:transposase
MKPMRRAPAVILNEVERQTLERWSRGRRTPARLVLRAKIVLGAADGKENLGIAEELGVGRLTVARWRLRFITHGLSGLEKDAPRGGRKPTIRSQVAQRIVEATTQTTPSDATHWSTRTLAESLGVSRSMVHRVWLANGLKPHLVRTFKVSNDPNFVEKLVDVVGLYLDPPEHALVLSVDEKSQIQALDRTQKSLPLYPGRAQTLTHDYVRNGTTTLFAALNVAEGIVISQCMKRHRHQEWIRFLKTIDDSTDPDLDLHLIVDNYATHKHPETKRWLERHPRFHVHFIPTSSSWLNLVERWFRDLTEKRLRRGVFRSVPELIKAINEYIETHNNRTTAGFQWAAKAEDILAKVRRAREVLNKSASE